MPSELELKDHMIAELASAIDEDFTASVCTYVIDALRASCLDAAGRHDDQIGCNANTFGMDSYHFAVHQLRTGLEDDPPGVELAPTGTELEFRLQVGRFRVAVHRVGSSCSDPIETSFPSSPHGPSRLARENACQLSLDFPTTSSSIPTNVIIAYMSNPGSGLEAVYIAVPFGSTDAGKIREWLYTRCIWRNGETDVDLPSLPDLPPEIPSAPADLKLRPETLIKE